MKLVRVSDTGLETFGVLMEGDVPFCVTLEDPWKNNVIGRSCIPTGTYTCTLVTTPHHGQVYQVMDVPGRTAILFHAGNTYVDTEGCILLGTQFGVLNGRNAVFNSRTALNDFMYRLSGAPHFQLEIIDASSSS